MRDRTAWEKGATGPQTINGHTYKNLTRFTRLCAVCGEPFSIFVTAKIAAGQADSNSYPSPQERASHASATITRPGQPRRQPPAVDETARRLGRRHVRPRVLRGEARRLNIRTIESATHIRNEAMRAVAKRQGRLEEFVILIDRIER